MGVALGLSDSLTAGLPGHDTCVLRGEVAIDLLPEADHAQDVRDVKVSEGAIVVGAIDENKGHAGRWTDGGEVVGADPGLRARGNAARGEVSAEGAGIGQLAALHTRGGLPQVFTPKGVPKQPRLALQYRMLRSVIQLAKIASICHRCSTFPFRAYLVKSITSSRLRRLLCAEHSCAEQWLLLG